MAINNTLNLGNSPLTTSFGGSGVTKIPSFSANLSGAQSIATSTYTKAQLATEIFDTDGYFDNVTNYRFTPLIAGKYLVLLTVTIQSPADQQYFIGAVYKNGSGVYYYQPRASGTSDQGGAASTIVSLNGSTDYIELYLYQDSGVNKSFAATTYFSAVWVGP